MSKRIRRYMRLSEGRADRDAADEIAYHLEMKIGSLIQDGYSPEAARSEAMRQFGDADRIQSEISDNIRNRQRDAKRIALFDEIRLNVRYALRTLRRSPGFAAVAVLSLAFGIGANTAIYTVMRASLTRPLQVSEPERLRNIVVAAGANNINWNTSYALYEGIRQNATRAFMGVTAHSDEQLALVTPSAAEQVHAAAVAGNFFDVIGLGTPMGRYFNEADENAGASVAVLGYDAWSTIFGKDRDVIGRSIQLNGRPFTVIGVAPRGFTGLWRGELTSVYIPLRTALHLLNHDDWITKRTLSFLNVVGRTAPGTDDAKINALLPQVTASLRADHLIGDRSSLVTNDASRGFQMMLADLSTPLKLLMGAVSLVVLIACANVASLLIVRARARTREVGIRLALGATGRVLGFQLLIESLVLSIIAGAIGLAIACWFTRLLVLYNPPSGASLAIDLHPDARVLAMTAGISILCGVVFGAAPALGAARTDLAHAMRGDTAVNPATRWFGARGVLVTAQVALSLVLLSGAVLLLSSLHNLKSVDVGYRERSALLADVDASATNTTPETGMQFYDELLQKMSALPGVKQAALASVITPQPGGSRFEGVALDPPATVDANGATYDIATVSPNYFSAVDLPIVKGRAFAPHEANVAIINEAMAARYWPGVDPIGKRIEVGGPGLVPIVGVAHDGKYRDLRETGGAAAFVPLSTTNYQRSMTLVLQTRGNPTQLTESLRRTLHDIDPGIPASHVRTLQEHIDVALSRDRLAANLGAVFAAFAVLLSAIGLYGMLAYAVAQRTREIGVRVALGASRKNVQGIILKAAAVILIAGIVVGIPAALATGKLLHGLLFGLRPGDPRVLAIAVAALIVTAALAAIVPVQRALRVDPMKALRED